MLEVIVAYGAPSVVGIYIAPVTRYVGRTNREDGPSTASGLDEGPLAGYPPAPAFLAHIHSSLSAILTMLLFYFTPCLLLLPPPVYPQMRERERSIKVLEVIVAYGAPPVAGNYIAPVIRYVGKTVGEDGGCCTRGAMATWGKPYAL